MSSKLRSRSGSSSKSKPLWAHQSYSKSFFREVPHGLDFSDPGTGKTRVHIELYAERPKHGRLLVVAPLSLMQPAWGVDVSSFAPHLSVGYSVATDRETPFLRGDDVVVINTDGVKWLAENLHLLKGFDHLIIDELSYFKHPTSQRSKAMAKIAKKVFQHRNIYGMTGTPDPNSVTELWHQVLIVDGGKRLGTSFYRFRNATQHAEQVGPKAEHLKWIDNEGVEDAVALLIKDITVRHEFEEVMTHVPPNHRQSYEIKLSPKLRKLYNQLEQEAYAVLSNGARISIAQASSMRQKLLQVCSGAIYTRDDPEGEGDYQLLDTSRYELMADLVLGRKHSVTFFNWRHQREQLEREFQKRGIEFGMLDGSVSTKRGNELVEEFQKGNLQTMLMHYKKGAHGLTLTAGDSTFFSSPIYEADYFKQAKHRIYRGAQDKPTNTVTVEALDTVETYVYEQLFNKSKRMADFLSLVKARYE